MPMLPAIAEAVSAQTWGAPIFEERAAPVGSSGSYANYLGSGMSNCTMSSGAIYSVNLGTFCLSAGGAYFVYGTGNTAAMQTEARLIEGRRPVTIAEVVPIQSHGASQLDRTIAALNQYRVSADGTSQNPASDALRFLDALPKYLPAPKAARSDTGTITLFWHVDNFYADAEFHGDSKFSIFTRQRVGGETHDEALDEEQIEQAAGAWLKTYMAPMLPRSLTAAA
jgi:hypothetical protein